MRIAFLLSVMICYIQSIAQTIINPVFDRTDQPSFHINKIEMTKDTTFVYCTYSAEAESWANISSETYLEDVLSGKKYTILKSDGLPFAPNQQDFLYEKKCEVKLSFPYLQRNVGKLNLIETPNGNGFNIYGIDILYSFSKSYSEQDVDSLFECAMACGENKEWKEAIIFSLERIRASECVYGIHSVERSWPMYDLTQEYFGIKDYDKVIEWGKKVINILSDFPQDSLKLDILARTYSNIGEAYRMKNQEEIAIEHYESSLSLRKRLIELYPEYKKSFGYFNFLNGLIRIYFGLNKIENARCLLDYTKSFFPSIYTRRSNQYLTVLFGYIYYYFMLSDYDSALKCAQEAYPISIELSENDLNSALVSNCVVNMLRLYNYKSDYKSTVQLGQKHYMLAEYDHDIAESLSDAYEALNDWDNSIKYREKSVALLDSLSTTFYYEMDKLSVSYMNKGDYMKSKELYERLERMNNYTLILDSVVYANVLSHISSLYSILGNDSISSKYAKKSKYIRYNLLKSNLDDKKTLYGNYLLSIVNVATVMISEKNYDEAISLLDEGIDFINENKDWLDSQRLFARIMSLKGSVYKRIGLFRDALDLFNAASNMQIRIDSLDYIHTLHEVSDTYSLMKDDATAIYYSMKAKEIAKSFVGESHPEYAAILTQLANSNYRLGNYPQAIELANRIPKIYEISYGANSYNYSLILNNMASLYHAIGEWQKEMQYKRAALQTLENIGMNYGILYSTLCRDIAPYNNDSTLNYLDKAKQGLILSENQKSKTMVEILQTEATYHMAQEDTIQALNCIHKSIRLIEEYGGENSKEYADMYKDLFVIDKPLSIEHAEKAFRLYKKLYDRNSFVYAEELFNYGKNLFISGNKSDSVISILKEASDIMKSHFRSSIFAMPLKETTTYWDRVLRNTFNQWLPLICSTYNTNQSNQLLYDNLLFLKGLLLSIDASTRQSVFASGNDSLVNSYKRFNEISATLDYQLSLPVNKRMDNVDSLLLLKEEIGWTLSRMINGNGHEFLTNYTWLDVKEKLKEKDLAVEFGNYSENEMNTIYYALVISKNSQFPELIELFDKKIFDSIVKKEKIDSVELSNLIWGPIIEKYTEVKNIYFSPFDILNLFGLEYLPVTHLVGDSLNFYRLSSTKELCHAKADREKENAILYGGIDYNSAVESNTGGLGEFDFSDRYKDLTRSIGMRGDFEPLYNTKEEVEEIFMFLSSKGVNCKLFKNKSATEKSLKTISGKSLSFLHIATHGMFLDMPESDKRKNEKFQFVISDQAADIEDKALSRSFLVMSGGNMLIHRDSLLYAEDDGILTALEISRLDLKNLDLVVLSACQSALGDITSEGVYGLQRGFKKAGANTILMSLNKVDDEATRILMVEFYRNLMNGKTKYQSLKEAQQHLRHVENGKYDDPKYWASFIMLDGLN